MLCSRVDGIHNIQDFYQSAVVRVTQHYNREMNVKPHIAVLLTFTLNITVTSWK